MVMLLGFDASSSGENIVAISSCKDQMSGCKPEISAPANTAPTTLSEFSAFPPFLY
jgi:hypothetical protein